MCANRFEGELKRAKFSKDEISKIIRNLDNLVEKGLSDDDIEIVVHNIINEPGFKGSFLKDPKGAVKKVGIVLHN
jgi:superfamily I DNA and RNA helicase